VIAVIDYNMGNLGSIQNMLKKLGTASEITCDPGRIAAADKLILPGVGAFDAGMEALEARGILPLLRSRVLEERAPVLGICLGMQLMCSGSAEGRRPGLGWIDATVDRFEPAPALKIPHMGWNLVDVKRASALTDGLAVEPRFYFVHSYHVVCRREEDVLLSCRHGRTFDAGFQVDNVWGVQFHPEKSHKFGMCLLRNFAERC
jgi:glutamine amidotransferase